MTDAPNVIEVADSPWQAWTFAVSAVLAVSAAILHGMASEGWLMAVSVGTGLLFALLIAWQWATYIRAPRIRFEDRRVRTREQSRPWSFRAEWVDADRVHVRGPSGRQIAAVTNDRVPVGIVYGQRLIIDGDRRKIDDDSWAQLERWLEHARASARQP